MKMLLTILRHPLVGVGLRLFLGISFVLSGYQKIMNLSDFAGIVRQFAILPGILADVFAYTLPFVEVLCGVYLLIGLFLKPAAAIVMLMLLSFMIATLVNLLRGTDLQNCGCFDPEELFGWHTFVRQIGYMAAAIWLWFVPPKWALQSLLKRKTTSEEKPTP